MNIKIITKFTIDPADPIGRKNLSMLTTAAGLRSQIEVVSLTNDKKQGELIIFLERPDYWGANQELLRHDLSSLMVHHKGKVVPAEQLLSFETIAINNSTGDADT